jgi:hypothetical protein
MEYAITVFVFLLVLAGGAAVLWVVSRATAEPDGEKDAPFAADDETPLGDTNEHSDAIGDREAA